MKKISIEDWKMYFPFDKIRKEQEVAINFALNSFLNENKKYVILELGTGVGKSATGITIARYMENHAPISIGENGDRLVGSYVVTTQKILQEQYLRDFGPSCGKNLVKSIKSSSNYMCSFYSDQTCAESKRILMNLGKQLNGTDFQKNCKTNCKYSIEKQEFIDSSIAVTNFPYLLAESTYAGKLEPRAMLIVDEAHNAETELGKFIEITFSEKFARDILKCKSPKSESQSAIFEWINSTYKKALLKHIKEVEKALEKLSNDIEGYGNFSKQYEILDKHVCKINRFIEVYKPENWIMNVALPSYDNKKAGKKFEFKPIDVSPYAYSSFFRLGNRVLLMSATIVNKEIFSRSIGIEEKDVSYLSIPSPFPVENRPVHFLPVGSMSKSTIDSTLPKMVEVVKLLLEKHPQEKGIIHCTNFKVAKYIKENVDSHRLVLHDSSNREEMLKFHVNSKDPTVLVSPSMMEGVDLHDDLSRFQIICKIPFPYLGDLVVKKRMEKNKFWYPYMTAKSIIQSLGRSIRNESDHAISYILDSDWEKFFRMNRTLFDETFKIF
jgi:ATP-dependent DNA helicase DinG